MDATSRLKHWWTQSDVFYAIRKLLIEYQYSNEREHQKSVSILSEDLPDGKEGTAHQQTQLEQRITGIKDSINLLESQYAEYKKQQIKRSLAN
jgi:hypothetical protein